jgi:LuxR family transcriptional regulator, quorum-sensing system regulator BjaR1
LSRHSRDHAFDLIEEIAGNTSLDGLGQSLDRHIPALGFTHVVISSVPQRHVPLCDWLILAQWPDPGWADHYSGNRYAEVCPVVDKVFRTAAPFTWLEARQEAADAPRACRILEEAAAFGIRSGVTTPVYGHDGLQGTFTLISDRKSAPLPAVLRATIHMISLAACAKAIEIARAGHCGHAPDAGLSPRETEVLKWVAAGKTNWEIGEILGKSERTIEHQVAGAARKLDAVTRAQIVAQAFRRKLIN